MSPPVSPTPEEPSVTAPLRPRSVIARVLRLGLMAAIAVPVVLTGLLMWDDHRERVESHAILQERNAHLLGPNRLPAPDSFHPVEVVPRPPVVDGFHIVSARDPAAALQDDELVLAVEINSQTRAWPLNIMTGPDREVFNDRLGGRSIAATW